MPERMDIDVLRTLKAIHDYGGVTRAAEQLSLTQSAVSHKIRRFEDSLGCRLLRRKPGAGLFTQDGKHLLTYAEKILSIHDEALQGIKKPELKGRIRLGITEELVSAGFSAVLARFGRLYPGVRVTTRVEQSLVLDEMLAESALDMVVMQVFEHAVRPADQMLQKDRLLWVKSIDYVIDDPGRIPFIAFDQNCFYRQWAAREFAGSEQILDVILECASNEGVCSAVSAGMGLALIAERHLRSDMEIVELRQPPAIAFVVRIGPQTVVAPVEALRDDVVRSLSI